MEQTIAIPVKWRQGTLITFRFFFVYFVLYAFPFPFQLIPYTSDLFQALTDFTVTLYQTIAKSTIGLQIPTGPNGSGDTSYNYIQIVLFIFSSATLAVLWSIIDRKRSDYENLFLWLITFLRYYLAFYMVGYGLVKVLKLQFPFPTVYRLYQSFGESSPMGLLWTFMGYSTAYNIFTGSLEVIGGVLLCFRRTRLLGALVVVAVMSNVVMLNFTYDVPVKLFSTHLLLIAVLIALPDVKRLANFFLFNETVKFDQVNSISHSKMGKGYALVKTLVVLSIFAINTIEIYRGHKKLEGYNETITVTQSLLGEYNVQKFELDGRVIAPDSLITQRWKRIILKAKTADIQYMDDTSGPWHFVHSPSNSRIIIHSIDLSSEADFQVQRDKATLVLDGLLDQRRIKIVCQKSPGDPISVLPLVSRGFHWINEYPFNK